MDLGPTGRIPNHGPLTYIMEEGMVRNRTNITGYPLEPGGFSCKFSLGTVVLTDFSKALF